MSKIQRLFLPDWVSPPRDTIEDILAERCLTIEVAAQECGLSVETLTSVLSNKLPIDREIAACLEQGQFGSTRFWLKRQEDYTLECIRLGIK